MDTRLKQFKGIEIRPQQIVMDAHIRNCFDKNFHAMVEAGTGVGKSLAYLLPAIEWSRKNNKKVVVSTFTKALQEQLMHKELPRLKKELADINFRYALCLGSQNFLCKRRFHKNNLPDLYPSPMDKEASKKIAQWVDTTPNGLFSDLPFEPSQRLWGQFNRDSDLCMRHKSPYFDECFYYRQQKEIKQADILVTNHHLFLTHVASGNRVLPKVDAVVFDEAHTLEAVATEYFGYKISNDMLKFHLDSLHSPTHEGGLLRRLKFSPHNIRTAKKLIDSTREAANAFFSKIMDKFTTQPQKTRIRQKRLVDNVLQGPMFKLIVFFKEILPTIQSKEDEKEWLSTIKKFQEIHDQLEIILNIQEPNCVYWVEIEQRARGVRCSLNKAPLQIAGIFQRQILECFSPVIVISATLTAKGSFDALKDSLGFDGKVSTLKLDSPFDYSRNVLLYLPQSVPDPGSLGESKEFDARALQETKRLIDLLQGRTFVLFTNTERMRCVALALEEAFSHLSIMKQGDLAPHALLEKFRKTEGAVLLGTNTFWQGVDVPGPALQCVIIWKLPFAVPDDPITEAKMEEYELKGKNAFIHYLLPRAVIMTRQGFGRLVRSQTDKGIVAILDPRTRTKGYGKDFLDSLPRCTGTTHFEDVKKFSINHLTLPRLQEIV